MGIGVTFSGSATANGTTGGTLALAAYNQTAGRTIIVAAHVYTTQGKDITSITDTAGNTYTQICRVLTSNGEYSYFFYVVNCLGNASNVITANYSNPGLARYSSLASWDASGLDLVSPLDVYNTTWTTNGQSVNLTTTFANELMISFANMYSGTGSPTAQSPYTSDGVSGVNASWGHQIVSTIQTGVHANYSPTTNCGVIVATFKAAMTSLPNSLMLMGCGT